MRKKGPRKSIIGNKYGLFTVLEFSHMDSNGNSYWKCKCICGNTETMNIQLLKHRNKKNSCVDCFPKLRYIDLTGKEFKNFKVIKRTKGTRKGIRYWICKCNCGNLYNVKTNDILSRRRTRCTECSLKAKIKNQIGKAKVNYGEANRKCVWHYYKSHAKSKNREFSITYEDFCKLTQGDCFYCGKIPSNNHCKTKLKASGAYIHNGIDRKNNSKGYSLDNCVPCCSVCNRSKNTMNHDEFIKLSHIIAKRFPIKKLIKKKIIRRKLKNEDN